MYTSYRCTREQRSVKDALANFPDEGLPPPFRDNFPSNHFSNAVRNDGTVKENALIPTRQFKITELMLSTLCRLE